MTKPVVHQSTAAAAQRDGFAEMEEAFNDYVEESGASVMSALVNAAVLAAGDMMQLDAAATADFLEALAAEVRAGGDTPAGAVAKANRKVAAATLFAAYDLYAVEEAGEA